MKKMISLVVVLVLALTASAFAASSGGMPMSGPYKDGSRLVFATGGEKGEYYALGSAIAKVVSRKTSTALNVVASKGAAENIADIESGRVQIAFIQSDVGFYASRGTRLFKSKNAKFSTVANLYLEPVQIVTMNPSIERVEDLKGKTISIGAEGSGTYFNAMDIFKAYGLDIDTDINPVYESFGDSIESLRAGKIDAAIVVAGAPTPAVSELAKTEKIYLVSFDDKHIMDLIAKSPYYGKCELDKSVYGTDDSDVTVAVRSVIIARDDVPANDVYNFMYGLFENLGEISHPKAGDLSLDFAAKYPAVPYHAGAVKYLGEKGILVSGK